VERHVTGARIQVLYDHYVFVKQRRGGVSRYFAHLMAELRRNPTLEVGPTVALRWTDNAHLLGVDMVRPSPGPAEALLRRQIALAAGRSIVSPVRIPKAPHRFSVLHSTSSKDVAFRREYSVLRSEVRHVVTVHDMIPEALGTPHAGKAWFIRDADALVFVSDATREDTVEHFGALEVPWAVIPHGIDERMFHPHGARPDCEAPYVVHVGARNGYKRFDVLLAALSLIDDDCRLVTIGSPFGAEERSLAEQLGVWDRIDPIIDASDADLARWLRGAIAFVSTSAIEGFGIPVLEAMACGAPTVLADTRVYREVGGAAALYFDEGSAEHLAELLRRLLGDGDLRARSGALGAARAAPFTWASTAASTAALYHEVAAG